ncbi:hypothetical protein [Comamonas endophytica]|uniref:hypothetical protein n=1 Tax=Comamonas endophytica TaxID=2949090 RepID=UPI00366C5922
MEIEAIDKVERGILDQLEGSVRGFDEVRLDWLEPKGWKVCYSREGRFGWSDVVSLIRYCKTKEIEKLLALSIFFIMEKNSSKARVFNAGWNGISQALWGVGPQRSVPGFKILDGAWLESFLITPYHDEICEFLLIRDVGEGVVLAGPEDFLEHMVSRSKDDWFMGNSLEFRREEEVFKAQKDRKTAIREEKMKRG